MEFNNNIKMTIISFVLICFGLYYTKPSFIFNNDGTFKQFGLNKEKTIYPFWLVSLILGIIIYLCIIIKNNDYI